VRPTQSSYSAGNADPPKPSTVALAGVHVNYSCTGFKGLLSLDLRHHRAGFTDRHDSSSTPHASPGLRSLSLVALTHDQRKESRTMDLLFSGAPHRPYLGWWFVEDAVRLLEVYNSPSWKI